MSNTPEDKDQTVFDIQSYFNSVQSKPIFCLLIAIDIDHEHECPFCFAHVQIILNETLLIGDPSQLDYSKIN